MNGATKGSSSFILGWLVHGRLAPTSKWCRLRRTLQRIAVLRNTACLQICSLWGIWRCGRDLKFGYMAPTAARTWNGEYTFIYLTLKSSYPWHPKNDREGMELDQRQLWAFWDRGAPLLMNPHLLPRWDPDSLQKNNLWNVYHWKYSASTSTLMYVLTACNSKQKHQTPNIE